MPFTQISLLKGKSLDYRRNLMEEVYLAMRESINIPENDRFATITELEDGNFNNSGIHTNYFERWPDNGQEKGALRNDRGTLTHKPRHSKRRCGDKPVRDLF